MAFKSYAEKGNYSTYAMNLPIDKEINEDLRVDGGRVRDIQLVAQQKQNHANQYLSALNNKFSVEQQNRDTNSKFFEDNFKAIYEGEQREFEGRMAELKREQAEAANKKPSTLEKALPHILSLVKIGAGMMAETAAAEKAAKTEEAEAYLGGVTQQFNDAQTPISHLDKGAETYNKALEEGLTKAQATKRVLEQNTHLKNSGIEITPDFLDKYQQSTGLSESAHTLSLVNNAKSIVAGRIQADSVHLDSNLNRLIKGRGNFSDNYINAGLYVTNAYKEVLGDNYNKVMKHPGAGADLRDAMSKAKASIRKPLAENTREANKENFKQTKSIALSRTVQQQGMQEALGLSLKLARTDQGLDPESKTYNSASQRLSVAKAVVQDLVGVGVTPAQLVEAQEIYYKNHTAPKPVDKNGNPSGEMAAVWQEGLDKLNKTYIDNQAKSQKLRAAKEYEMLTEMKTMGATPERTAYAKSLMENPDFPLLSRNTQTQVQHWAAGVAAGLAVESQASNPLNQVKHAVKIIESELYAHIINQGGGDKQSVISDTTMLQSELWESVNYKLGVLRTNNKSASTNTLFKMALKEALEEHVPPGSVKGNGGTLPKDNFTVTTLPRKNNQDLQAIRNTAEVVLQQKGKFDDGYYVQTLEDNPVLQKRIQFGNATLLNNIRRNGTMTEAGIIASFNTEEVRAIHATLREHNPNASITDVMAGFAKAAGASGEVLSKMKEHGTSEAQIIKARQMGMKFNFGPGTTSTATHLAQGGRFTPSSYVGKTGGTPGTPGAGNTTGPHLHLETGDGYTGGGNPIPDYVLNEVYAGDKPLSAYIVTSGIGPRESPGGVGSTIHKGIDLNIPHGTPLTIKPGSDLQVTERDDKTSSGYGYVTVITNTKTNEPFTFGHLSDVGGN